MKKFTCLILSFLAILSVENVRALSFNHFSTGYSYSQPNHNISDTWVTYSTSNNTKSLSQLPNQEQIFINEFSFRFGLNNNGFKQGSNYIITFDWANYDYADEFINYYDRMTHTLGCRVTNWNTTNQSADYCFTVNNVVASGDDQLITITISFTPKIDFFGLTLTNKVNSNPEWPTSGWEVSTASYSVVSDGTQDIINNNNQNTQNIINNNNQNTEDIINNQNQNSQDITNALDGVLNGATQNTEDIINNQNQNTQDIQNTINDNFQTCRDSYNLFRSRSDFTTGILTMSNGVITLNGTLTSNTSVRVGYISAPVGSYTINPYKSGSINNSYFYFYIEGSSFSFSSQKSFTLNSALTDESVWLVLTRGDYDNITMSVMLNFGDTSLPYEKYGEQVCKNKMDETNDSINDINDTINNSDVSDAESDASNFFSSFTTSDNGGISGIVTAPLRLIQSLVAGESTNCSNSLRFNVLGADVEMPSGCILWNLAPNSVVTLYRTFICGSFAYILLRKLFKDIEKLKNPGDSEVSTLDL